MSSSSAPASSDRYIVATDGACKGNPGPAGRFDGVTVGATLNETARPAVFLRALEAQLRPGGRLWLMFAAPPDGPAPRLLARLGGLSFPDAAWVQAQLPGCTLVHAARFGAVQVMLLRREATPVAVG